MPAVPYGVITLGFDPTLHAGPFSVRWETLGLAAALFVALLVAAASARAAERGHEVRRLRPDDLLFLAVAAVPGAVAGGRIVLVLDYLDYYRTHLAAIADPAQGSLSLLGAVLGGTLTVALMCRLLDVPARRWLDVAAVPLLLAIGLGKLAYLLGGGGQGVPWDGPWALAFGGPGPWLAAIPSLPSQPSQAYEGIWTLAGAAVLFVALGFRRGARRSHPGLTYAGALAWWLIGRALIGFTWADPAAVAGLNAEQAGALVALAVVAPAAAWELRPRRRSDPGQGEASSDGPAEAGGRAHDAQPVPDEGPGGPRGPA